MFNQAHPTSLPRAGSLPWVVEPFLHVEQHYVYNPITDRTLEAHASGFTELHALIGHQRPLPLPLAPVLQALADAGWLVPEGPQLSERYYLKYVSLEAHTACNQACYFCPVSVAPRTATGMSLEFYAHIVAQLSAYRDTIEGVFLNQYNEPTLDPHFVDHVRLLKQHGLAPALLTNGSGLTPKRVDELLALGGLGYLSVNLSTLNRERYAQDRGRDHLPQVLANLNYLKNQPLAPKMDLVVLGLDDAVHHADAQSITQYFAGSRFEVRPFTATDRNQYLDYGLPALPPHATLCGCEQLGSRPLQHLHITATGKCVLCCQDYNEEYEVGDLHTQTIQEILTGPALARMRRWAYGLEEAPADFICRRCIFARVPTSTRHAHQPDP